MPEASGYPQKTTFAAGDELLGFDSENSDAVVNFTRAALIDAVTGEVGSGDSAYDIAVANGFVGTEVEWLASLEGADGDDGLDGDIGPAAIKIFNTGSGTWTADAPAGRSDWTENVEFIGPDDPADVTDGVTTPANIVAGDSWSQTDNYIT